MDFFQIVFSLIGAALCSLALMQFALWSSQSLSLISQNNKQFELARELFRKQIEESGFSVADVSTQDGGWVGFRSFRVARLVKETNVCTSVYLTPEDGKPTATFRPGQHLTFKFEIPGEPKPVIRCYSLSNRPGELEYRITVKSIPAPIKQPELPQGRASNFINQTLTVGDRIDVKTPAGHFVLDESSDTPIVLLAGGIGITPMISMVDHLVAMDSDRPVLLLYGVQNGADQAFKKHLQHLGSTHKSLNVVNCYSHATDDDVEGTDYQVKGFASVDLLKKILPNNQCQFYMCGPPPFMEALYSGLIDWGVSESTIFYEAFGPASIGKTKKQPATTSANASNSQPSGATVKFASSDLTVEWDPSFESLLELAEANDVSIDTGCRVGSCGTCATSLLKGKVVYPDQQAVDCEPGKCLVCIARPDGPIELDT